MEQADLFDLSMGPHEQHSLAVASGYTAQVHGLCARLETLQQDLQDRLGKTLDNK